MAPPHNHPEFPPLPVFTRQHHHALPQVQVWHDGPAGLVLHCPCTRDQAGTVGAYYCPNAQRRHMIERRCGACSTPLEEREGCVVLGVVGRLAHTAPPMHPACLASLLAQAPALLAIPNAVVTPASRLRLYQRRIHALPLDGQPRFVFAPLPPYHPEQGIWDLVVAVPDNQHPIPLASWSRANTHHWPITPSDWVTRR